MKRSEQVLLKRVNEMVARLCANREKINLMEVCGTHTMAISSSGIRKAVDQRLRLVSGPGCPVCVTTDDEVDEATFLAGVDNITILTFGDMMRVTGSSGSLLEAKARGADVRVVYSPLDGLKMAAAEPEREFVFLGVGFETTAPTVAAAVIAAKRQGIKNFSVLPMFKLIPPALDYIASSKQINIDGFILPGHVSTIIGSKPYSFLVRRYHLPCCITGFEATDILGGIYILLNQIANKPEVAIQYQRSVRPEGNLHAQRLMRRVFRRVDASWRGIGLIKKSGLKFREGFQRFDARKRFDEKFNGFKTRHRKNEQRKNCRCGEVMLGVLIPTDCPLFARACTPARPFGPCMVSSEGACAAYYKYER
ncbi:MAG: hydrogenase formation protein HypD [candidate division WOR-3 bacterium]